MVSSNPSTVVVGPANDAAGVVGQDIDRRVRVGQRRRQRPDVVEAGEVGLVRRRCRVAAAGQGGHESECVIEARPIATDQHDPGTGGGERLGGGQTDAGVGAGDHDGPTGEIVHRIVLVPHGLRLP